MTQRGFDDEEDEDDVPEWADHVTANVAGEVRRRRKELGWSAQKLADKCADIGHSIPRNVIANMESGRRSNLPLVDVIVLAKALYTSPLSLIYPLGYVTEVQRLPLQDTEYTWDAMRWFTGEVDDYCLDGESGMLRSFREHARLQRAVLAALEGEKREKWRAEKAVNQAERDEALHDQAAYAERAVLAKYELRSTRGHIREDGGTPPVLPPGPELADVDPPETNTNNTEENNA